MLTKQEKMHIKIIKIDKIKTNRNNTGKHVIDDYDAKHNVKHVTYITSSHPFNNPMRHRYLNFPPKGLRLWGGVSNFSR